MTKRNSAIGVDNLTNPSKFSRLERFGGIKEREGIGEVACMMSVLRWRGPHNSEKRTKNFNKKLEKARGSKAADFSTSSRVQEFKHSSFKNVQVSRTLKIKKDKDQERSRSRPPDSRSR